MLGVRKKFKSEKIDTLVGPNTRILGDISFTGGLHVDGIVKGNVVADNGSSSVLTLSENGKIDGEVRVPNIILNGTVVGDVYAAERIELAARARVSGDVYYNLIEMAMGAEVNGSLKHNTEASKPKLVKHDAAKTAQLSE